MLARLTTVPARASLLIAATGALLTWSATVAAATDPAVSGLPAGWTSTTLYEGPLGVYPNAITQDATGNLLVYDSGASKLYSLSPNGTVSRTADLSSLPSVTAMAWQAPQSRLLLITSAGSLYAYTSKGVSQLQAGGVYGGAMAVNPSDGSFYAGTLDVAHYDSAGNLLATPVPLALGISQMAFDGHSGQLYYSETYAGDIIALNTATGATQNVVSNVGIPGTSEPIGVAVDGQGTLYYFPSATGLYRYANGSASRVLASIGGAGNIVWSTSRSAIVQTQGAGANLLLYDPNAGASSLTPYVNAFAIAELTDGRLIFPDYSTPNLMQIASGNVSVFASRSTGACNAFTRDDAGEVYAACNNAIFRVGLDGSLTLLTTLPNPNAVSLAFDSLNQALIVTGNNAGSQPGNATIYRVPLSAPSSMSVITSFQNIVANNVLPGVAADAQGNVYVLERSANAIYLIANGSSTPTTFASNVLPSAAVTVPHMTYLASVKGLLISTINEFDLWPIAMPAKQVFATNAGAVDNFTTFQTLSGDIVAAHSGQYFRISGAVSHSTSDCLFNWAEQIFPQDFAPAGAQSQTYPPYYYRYYAKTNNYLATSSADNHVWLLGPVSGGNLLDAGPAGNFINGAGCP